MLAQAGALAFALAVFVSPIAAQEFRTTEQLRARFTHETDPAHKAKLLQPLGDSEFKDAQAALAEDKFPAALEIVKQYVDEAQSCDKALEAKFPAPEKHSGGFKELQISVRESLRRLDAMIVGLSADDRTPFVEIRSQLEEMDRHLIQQLFPKDSTQSPKAKPKS
ncbi:MAG TPA: hypothetical protein VK795_10820 [Terriglobales bacterium]|nr:hypothetical protein [Terriglobales bacterium]